MQTIKQSVYKNVMYNAQTAGKRRSGRFAYYKETEPVKGGSGSNPAVHQTGSFQYAPVTRKRFSL